MIDVSHCYQLMYYYVEMLLKTHLTQALTIYRMLNDLVLLVFLAHIFCSLHLLTILIATLQTFDIINYQL